MAAQHRGQVGDPMGGVEDVVLWRGQDGIQRSEVAPAYRAILTDFSTRFVAGLDYGGGRPPLSSYIKTKAANVRLIVRDLPEDAKHNIGYRNAWRLLTGREWKP